MKYFYFESDNTIIEKNNICYKYFEKSHIGFKNHIEDITGGFDTVLDALNLYLNSTYFNDEQKKNITDFKNVVIQRKNELKQKN